MVAGVAELAASSTPTRLAGTWRPCRRGRCFAGNSYSSKIPAQGCVPKRGGTPGAGIQDAGNGDSGVLESEIHELRIQGAGTRDSVGIMASRPHGTRIQGCRNRELRAAWDLDSRMPKTVTLKAEILAHWEPGFRGGGTMASWQLTGPLAPGIPAGSDAGICNTGRHSQRRLAFVTPAGCAQCCQIPGGMLHLE